MKGVLKRDEDVEKLQFLIGGKPMNGFKKLFIGFIITALVVPASLEALSQEELDLWVDYASFLYQPDTTKSYVEIYYSLNRAQLDFYPQTGNYLASILSMELFIQDLEGDSVESRRWEVATTIKTAEEKEISYRIIDILGTTLQPGDYSLKFSVQDLNSKKKGSSEIKLNVPAFSEKGLLLSQIELAYNIEPETLATKFTKGARKVMPNPPGLFTQQGQMLYFYAEAYNLALGNRFEGNYSLSFNVLDENGEEFKDFGTQLLKKPGKSAVIISGINISTLPKGNYKLRIAAEDPLTAEKAQSIKDFKIWQEERMLEEPGFELLADEDQARKLRDEIRYIATRAELKMWDQLNLEGKSKFLEEFWRKREPDPLTPKNEAKIEYYRRWNYANSKFSRYQGSDDGWQTDMGRIYIKYGHPDDIERHPHSLDYKPWEKWHYDEIDESSTHPRQSGVLFIFVDEDGFGVYRLIHSTAVGEIQNLRWFDSIKLESEFR
ncbi:MAG: GWxTD domain-containing protein [Candidatus Zixiibacteriota bacterium]